MQRHGHGLGTEARHRAMGDIEAVVAYLDFAKRELGEARVLEAVVSLAKGPIYPPASSPTFLMRSRIVLKAWLYPGRIRIREHDEASEHTQFHVFDNSCHIGTVEDERALADALETCSSLNLTWTRIRCCRNSGKRTCPSFLFTEELENDVERPVPS